MYNTCKIYEYLYLINILLTNECEQLRNVKSLYNSQSANNVNIISF